MYKLKSCKRIGNAIFCMLLITLSLSACGKKELLPADKHDEVVFTIDDLEITVGDMLYYIYSVEQLLQEQAYVYDKEDPTQYWKIYTNGRFMKLFAKDMCLERAERDYILEAEAKAYGIELSDEDTKSALTFAEETFSDIDSVIIKRLGLTQDMLNETMLRSHLASLCAQTIVEEENLSEEDLEIGGDYYNTLKDKHKIEINEKVWEEVDFGNITVNFE